MRKLSWQELQLLEFEEWPAMYQRQYRWYMTVTDMWECGALSQDEFDALDLWDVE